MEQTSARWPRILAQPLQEGFPSHTLPRPLTSQILQRRRGSPRTVAGAHRLLGLSFSPWSEVYFPVSLSDTWFQSSRSKAHSVPHLQTLHALHHLYVQPERIFQSRPWQQRFRSSQGQRSKATQRAQHLRGSSSKAVLSLLSPLPSPPSLLPHSLLSLSLLSSFPPSLPSSKYLLVPTLGARAQPKEAGALPWCDIASSVRTWPPNCLILAAPELKQIQGARTGWNCDPLFFTNGNWGVAVSCSPPCVGSPSRVAPHPM